MLNVSDHRSLNDLAIHTPPFHGLTNVSSPIYGIPASRKFRLTNFHEIDIFQTGIRRVAVQIIRRFQGKSLGSEGNVREI